MVTFFDSHGVNGRFCAETDAATGPAVSVVVPVYKGVRFLREAIESLKAQTFRDWECICVDDGSTDGSGALADELASEDARVRVFHRPNGGTSVARNFALKQVRGRYVAFLDEDDVYRPEFLQVLYDAAVRTGADIVGCDNVEFEEKSHPVFTGEVPPSSCWKVADRPMLAEWMSRLHAGIPFSVWLNLYRRELACGHDFPPHVRVEQDMVWHYTLMPQVGKYVRIPWAGYAWRASSTGGYLHPDAESLISWTRSFRLVVEEVVPALRLDAEQRRRLLDEISRACQWHIWRTLRDGLALSRDQSSRLRRGLRGLARHGIDVRRHLGRKKRLKWSLFMLTGLTAWVRK